SGALGHGHPPSAGKVEEQAEGENSLAALSEVRINVLVGHRGEDLATLFGTADENVETALAAFGAERPESHWDTSTGDGRSVTHRNEDHVAFVTLNVLKILDEERL